MIVLAPGGSRGAPTVKLSSRTATAAEQMAADNGRPHVDRLEVVPTSRPAMTGPGELPGAQPWGPRPEGKCYVWIRVVRVTNQRKRDRRRGVLTDDVDAA